MSKQKHRECTIVDALAMYVAELTQAPYKATVCTKRKSGTCMVLIRRNTRYPVMRIRVLSDGCSYSLVKRRDSVPLMCGNIGKLDLVDPTNMIKIDELHAYCIKMLEREYASSYP